MPINDPSANSGYILDVDDEIKIFMIGDRSDSYTFKSIDLAIFIFLMLEELMSLDFQ